MSRVLQELRAQLDHCDAQLLRHFRKRMAIIQEVAAYKKEHRLPIYDPQREEEILARYEESEQEFFRTLLRLSRFEQSLVLFPYTIVLIGFMGVGKSSVGAQLAQHLGREFLDLDQMLEGRLGMPIAEFFTRHGEVAFRQEESLLLAELTPLRGVVIATGGGAVLDPQNVAALRQQGPLVLLTAEPQTISTRLAGDRTRPVLAERATVEGIAELLAERQPVYEQVAQVTIRTDQLRVQEVVTAVLRSLAQADDKLASF